MNTATDSWIEYLGQILETFLLPFMARFVAEGSHFAAGLAFILIGLSITIGVLIFFRLLPTRISLWTRVRRISSLLKPATSDEQRRQLFAENYSDHIDPVMTGDYNNSSNRIFRRYLSFFGDEMSLQLAWSEIKETIIDEDNKRCISNTIRPHGYLMRVVPKPQRFAGLASIFVSVGLLLTFVGIISVLLKAGCDLRDGSSYGICTEYLEEVARVELALGNQPDELTVPPSETPSTLTNTEGIVLSIIGGAASKFYASIGGLAASIILKLLLEMYSFSLRRGAEELADLIERGLAYRPEQQLAVDQLSEAKEQTTQLKMFNTDFAIAIGDRLTTAFQPMTEQLSNIQVTLENQAADTASVLKEGVGSAINSIAGGEIQELGNVLGDLRKELMDLSGKLSEGGDIAASKLSEAASSLEEVSQRMGEELQSSAKNFGAVGNEFREQLLATTTRMEESIDQITTEMREAQQASTNSTIKAGKEMENAVERITSLFNETSIQKLSDHIDERMSTALTEASTQTSRAAQEAGEQIKRAFKSASESWMTSVDGATSSIKSLAEKIEQNVQAVGRHAQTVDTAAISAKAAGTAIGQSATDLKKAADPIRMSAESMRSGAEKIVNTVSILENSTSKTLTEVSNLAAEMQSTAKSAEKAWVDYKNRFGDVDEQLEKAVRNLGNVLQSNATGMRKFVSDIDSDLAKAVTQLGNSIKPLTEFTDEVEEILREIEKVLREAASKGGN